MRKLFNEGFSFLLMEEGSCFADFKQKENEAKPVRIPHDWAIGDFASFYKDGVGFYTKHFEYSASQTEYGENGHIYLKFDGVYMDSSIYLNDEKIYEWKYGYTSFIVDLTDYLIEGENVLTVQVVYKNPNSRWYSGAGIYRNIWWNECNETYIPDGGVYVHYEPVNADELSAGAIVTAEVAYEGKTIADGAKVVPKLCDDNQTLAISNITSEHIPADRKIIVKFQTPSINLWNVDSPYLYTLELDLVSDNSDSDNTLLHKEIMKIGFRFIDWNPNNGFVINGQNIKLNGVCEHHDFGSLGAAFYPDALERKLDKLKKMGVNSIRTSHNPVPSEFYDMCDKHGILVDSEAFDMWEMSKTEYDYARFFPEWYKIDVARWVKDARNHPSIIMWSIGNEIPDTHAGPRGREVANALMEEVLINDPMKNARVTFGSNYMPWKNTQIVADDLKIVGYNYAENLYDEHHEEHPDWIIYGSETSSIVYSRGVYHFPLNAGILSDDDLQCSSLGNSTTSWGASSMEACISVDADKKYSLGQYLWTGFDYLGEPTPYWTKNSYFGQLDTAGFPKDAYYAWMAAWTDASTNPMVHVFPYWNFNPGQKIDIRVCSNGAEVELLVNGTSQGRHKLGKGEFADYSVDFVPGELTAIAYDGNGSEIARESRFSYGDTDHIEITRTTYGTLTFYEMQAVDCNGHPVEDACDYLKITAVNGDLLALDNGDSTDYDSYLLDTRRLFRGKLLAIVHEEEDSNSDIAVEILKDRIPVREVILRQVGSDGPVILSPEKKTITIKAEVVPADAENKEITFRLSDIYGNDTNLATMTVNEAESSVSVEGLGDGEFVLRAVCNDGEDHARVISQLEIKAEGLGSLYTNPYEFVPGSIYSRSIGGVTNGNERGVATGRDGDTTVIFEDVDFGKAGTRIIEIPIFALTDEEYSIEIWEGVPGEEGAKLVCDGIYQKHSIWNTYQAETYTLDERITGIKTISFKFTNKVHFKGFLCTEINPIYEPMWAGEAPQIYGDQYEIIDGKVEQIGNNVSIGFGKMDFGSGVSKVTIYGHARNIVNTIHVRIHGAESDIKEVLEYEPTDGYVERTYDITTFVGEGDLSVIFMPGSDFDLAWIKFEE